MNSGRKCFAPLIKSEIKDIRDGFKSVQKYSPIDLGPILKHLFFDKKKINIFWPKPFGAQEFRSTTGDGTKQTITIRMFLVARNRTFRNP